MSSSKTRIFFRADGNSEIGLGHVVRCLSLIEMLSGSFECHFMIRKPEPMVKEMVETFCAITELPDSKTENNEVQFIKEYVKDSDILVVDNYNLNSSFQKEAKTLVKKLVTIDDEASIHIYADMVINHASPEMKDIYLKEEYTRILTGPSYLIARKEFRYQARKQRTIEKVESLFVCMGGADPQNITIKVVSAALKCKFLKKIVVVTGSAYAFIEELSQLINNSTVQWERNISASRMIELMNNCELAIATASSISLEICCVKAGLITGIVAQNQKNIHDYLVSQGCALTINDFRNASEDDIVEKLFHLSKPERTNRLVQKQAKLFDGLSGERILNEFNALANE